MKTIVISVCGGIVLLVLCGVFALWALGYKYCNYGESLLITQKTGTLAAPDSYAKEGQQGVSEQIRGPGRYFDLDPYHYSVEVIPDKIIKPGFIGLVKNNIGKDLPSDRFLAGAEEKGTQKIVATPGAWRINTFGQQIDTEVPATVIKPGYVGVQTLREGKVKGVIDRVLQAGYYNINPMEIRVDEVGIGYDTSEFHVETEIGSDGKERVKEGTGVSFPLADGKQMLLDITVVWGLNPEDTPRIVRDYGTEKMVEDKIIKPQLLSICKNLGSNLTTQQFIQGDTREQFQDKVTQAMKDLGQQKGMRILIVLVRGFHPSEDIKATIQARMIAEQERETLMIEQARDTMAANLEAAKKMVDVAIIDFDSETTALVATEQEKGFKKAAEIKEEGNRKVAELERKTAEILAQITRIKGQAGADVIEATKKAEASGTQLMVEAYGGPEAYNLATFAEGLPSDLKIEYRYAGEGTLWTDVDLKDVAARKILTQPKRKPVVPKTGG
ncbi:MAG: SPFH domain-containing protein [Phycisphaerae bacterium]